QQNFFFKGEYQSVAQDHTIQSFYWPENGALSVYLCCLLWWNRPSSLPTLSLN
ncbi:mCG1035459, partial [Mus musculus]